LLVSGRVVHFEIPYDDGDRARAFYANVFGWQLLNPPGMGYTLVTTGPTGDRGPDEPGFINGGMLQRQDFYTAPNIVIHVDGIEDALRRIAASGGSIVRGRQAVGDAGFAAYFRDPEGNLIGLWETPAT
jgi:uncharacterized protein